MIGRCVGCGNSGIVHSWVVRCSIVAPLSLLLCAMVANRRVDEKANEGEAWASQYHVNIAKIWKGSQDKNAEAHASCAGSPHDSHEVHNQYTSKEASLKAIHRQKCPRLQRITYEKHDSEDIDEETYDDEEHENHDAPAIN